MDCGTVHGRLERERHVKAVAPVDRPSGNTIRSLLANQRDYDHLREIAAALLRRERRHIFQPEDLVHEVVVLWLRSRRAVRFSDWEHLKRSARSSMSRTLIDHVRAGATLKRGKGAVSLELSEQSAMFDAHIHDSVWVSQALQRLSVKSDRKGAVARLRIMGSLSLLEIAKEIQISHTTVKRDWREACAFLLKELQIRRLNHGFPSGDETCPTARRRPESTSWKGKN
jgi:RNA polymerase sigma factor (TIGR02999 family)